MDIEWKEAERGLFYLSKPVQTLCMVFFFTIVTHKVTFLQKLHNIIVKIYSMWKHLCAQFMYSFFTCSKNEKNKIHSNDLFSIVVFIFI